ncbi:MAG: NAD(P)H-dependent oxidoreductase [Reyranellaceae bacterium]
MAAIIDTALQRRAASGRPIRVGLIGSGFMAKGIALQLATVAPGIGLAAVASRNPEAAEKIVADAGLQPRRVDTPNELRRALREGMVAITEDWLAVCQADGIDAVLEVTGSIDYAAQVASAAIAAGKHLILMNAELDGTVGPLLARRAAAAGVVCSNADGDQPGVTMNLFRFVRGIGVRPVLCGNIKGLHDPYRTPATQAEFAARWGQKPHMVTSFADGTKVSLEQAIIANATGMGVGRRGMFGPTVTAGTPIEEAARSLPAEDFIDGPGIVDYVVGAAPSPGVFVLGTIDNAVQRHYLELYKLGKGPLYCFYTPYHLCHFEVPNTVARAVLFQDATIAPVGAPRVEVVAAMKRDAKAGEVLDGLGHFMTYGLCENADVARRQRLLPIGIAGGCRLRRDVGRDVVLSYRDVELPAGRLIDRLRAEQEAVFAADGGRPARAEIPGGPAMPEAVAFSGDAVDASA